MVETKNRLFGQNITDTVRDIRLILGKDRKGEPKFPLSPEGRLRVERDNERILEKVDFGRGDFEDFCKNMIALVKSGSDSVAFGKLVDEEERMSISFNLNEIRILTYKEALGKYEQDYSLRYVPQQFKDHFLRDSTPTNYKPTLSWSNDVPVPKDIQYFSHFERKQVQLFPTGRFIDEGERKLSDKEVQEFCRWTDSVYAKLKTAPASVQQ